MYMNKTSGYISDLDLSNNAEYTKLEHTVLFSEVEISLDIDEYMKTTERSDVYPIVQRALASDEFLNPLIERQRQNDVNFPK